MTNKAKQGRDFEDRLKTLVHKSVLEHRKNLCNSCEFKGINNFCQKNYEYLPEFQLYRYHACPEKKWTEHWQPIIGN